ncbi:MAG TPA: permease-like cell division protein FtsX [Gaiellaceae bacterium]|nr:permease-like cell division protein FtsX [Gaiellaceae bacterium]
MRLKMMLGEAVRSIGANVSTTVAATLTVLIGMFLLGLFIAFASYANSWSDHVKRELVVKVFFDRDAPRSAVETVRVKLESDPRVDRDKLEFVSAEEGLRRMREQRPDLFNTKLPYNPLGHAYTVVPKKAEDTEAIAASLQPRPPGVHNVTYGEEKAKRILRVANVINSIFLLAGLILLAASTILIANTIRLSIFSRRREIEVMKLVGATNWFVRGPFMLEGLLCGLVGSVLAVILLFLSKEIALPSIIPRLDSGPGVEAISFWANALILLGIGLLLGAAGSGLTLRRFLRV